MNEVVNIKGTRHGLLILFDPDKDFEDIRENLKRKMEAARGFFRGAEFAFYKEPLIVEQKKMLEDICQEYGLIHQPAIRAKISSNTDSSQTKVNNNPVQVAAVSNDSVKINVSTGNDTLLVKRSLRSGQQIKYPGHVVILGDIHPGAEVKAYGNVMVLGSCRGLVHAGADGNNSARVIAHRLAPAQLRIGTSIACAPDGPGQAKYPEVAFLDAKGQIIVEAYNSGRPTKK